MFMRLICDLKLIYYWERQRDNIKSNKEYWISKIERNMQRDNIAGTGQSSLLVLLMRNNHCQLLVIFSDGNGLIK